MYTNSVNAPSRVLPITTKSRGKKSFLFFYSFLFAKLHEMTNSNSITSNIFVQQTFDGEKMVSSSVLNRRAAAPNVNDTSSATPTIAPAIAPAIAPTTTTASPATAAITIPATAATTSLATATTTSPATAATTSTDPMSDTPPVNNNNNDNSNKSKTDSSTSESSHQTSEFKFVSATIPKSTSLLKSANKEPIASRLANHLQQQRASHSAAQNKTKKNETIIAVTSPQVQHTSQVPPQPTPKQELLILPPPQQQQPPVPAAHRISPVSQPQYLRNYYSNRVDYKRYWSEANVAVLIQLHRKHYHGIISEDLSTRNRAWNNLTLEYNGITNDDREETELRHKWAKLLAKYNAERCCLMQQRRVSSGLQQPMPLVSYWNHFQYMDGYLSHLPVQDQHLYTRKRKRSQGDSQISQFLETQRLFLEHTTVKQQQQFDIMKENYDSMNKMNTKFVELCERATSGSRANEERYFNLIEKLVNREEEKKDCEIEKTRESNASVSVKEDDAQQTDTLSD